MRATVSVTGIAIRGVWAAYEGEREGAHVLEDVTLDLGPGRPCALLGPNGAGKSSLVRVVAGLLAASRGSVEVLGRDVRTLERAELARLVAVVPQTTHVVEAFTVREVVAMGRAPHQGAWMRPSRADAAAVDRALDECALEDVADRLAAALSGGEQRRVAIARAFAQEAPVLLLDEPASHLDLRHAAATWSLVTKACRERDLVCLAVLHDLTAAARFAETVVLMADGRIVAQGAPQEILTAERLEAVFGAKIDVSTAADGLPVFVASL